MASGFWSVLLECLFQNREGGEQGLKGQGPLGYHGAVLILRFLGFRIRIVSFIVNNKAKPGGKHRWTGGLGGCCCGLDSPTLRRSLTEVPWNP